MKVSIQSEDNGVVILTVAGRVTQDQLSKTPDPLGDILGSDAFNKRVAIDLSETEFLDSSGVSWLLVSHKKYEENGGRMVLFGVPQIVMNVIKVLRMQLVFNLADNQGDALRILQETKA